MTASWPARSVRCEFLMASVVAELAALGTVGRVPTLTLSPVIVPGAIFSSVTAPPAMFELPTAPAAGFEPSTAPALIFSAGDSTRLQFRGGHRIRLQLLGPNAVLRQVPGGEGGPLAADQDGRIRPRHIGRAMEIGAIPGADSAGRLRLRHEVAGGVEPDRPDDARFAVGDDAVDEVFAGAVKRADVGPAALQPTEVEADEDRPPFPGLRASDADRLAFAIERAGFDAGEEHRRPAVGAGPR